MNDNTKVLPVELPEFYARTGHAVYIKFPLDWTSDQCLDFCQLFKSTEFYTRSHFYDNQARAKVSLK